MWRATPTPPDTFIGRISYSRSCTATSQFPRTRHMEVFRRLGQFIVLVVLIAEVVAGDGERSLGDGKRKEARGGQLVAGRAELVEGASAVAEEAQSDGWVEVEQRNRWYCGGGEMARADIRRGSTQRRLYGVRVEVEEPRPRDAEEVMSGPRLPTEDAGALRHGEECGEGRCVLRVDGLNPEAQGHQDEDRAPASGAVEALGGGHHLAHTAGRGGGGPRNAEQRGGDSRRRRWQEAVAGGGGRRRRKAIALFRPAPHT